MLHSLTYQKFSSKEQEEVPCIDSFLLRGRNSDYRYLIQKVQIRLVFGLLIICFDLQKGSCYCAAVLFYSLKM